jgi:hypothetical protein
VFFIKNRTRGMVGKETKRGVERRKKCVKVRERRVDVEERVEPPLLRLIAVSKEQTSQRGARMNSVQFGRCPGGTSDVTV